MRALLPLSKGEAGRMAERLLKFIHNLQAALRRIENKTYGICRQTGKLIPKERLPRCASCYALYRGEAPREEVSPTRLMTRSSKTTLWTTAFIVLLLVIDQASKIWVKTSMVEGGDARDHLVVQDLLRRERRDGLRDHAR